jgi:16S rRNA G966 N2-methylase RsmD
MQADPASRLLRSLRDHGLQGTLQSGLGFVEDVFFDWRHGTDTVVPVHHSDLAFEHRNKASAQPYMPTRGRAFRALMKSIPFPPNSVFVDYGSGKGKVLLLASSLGFARVVGVEYSPELHEVAAANVRRYRGESKSKVKPICCDATEYVLHDDENVFFFFNPFGLDVLRGVLQQISASLLRKPRKFWVVFAYPRFFDFHPEFLDARLKEAFRSELDLRQPREFRYGAFSAVIFES